MSDIFEKATDFYEKNGTPYKYIAALDLTDKEKHDLYNMVVFTRKGRVRNNPFEYEDLTDGITKGLAELVTRGGGESEPCGQDQADKAVAGGEAPVRDAEVGEVIPGDRPVGEGQVPKTLGVLPGGKGVQSSGDSGRKPGGEKLRHRRVRDGATPDGEVSGLVGG